VEKIEKNPDKINKAVQLWNKYPKTKQGMKQAIKDNGGSSAFDTAVNALKKNTITRFALKGLGFDIDKIAEELKQSDNQIPNKEYAPENNGFKSLKDRIKKL
jgi:hypothetical protein